MENLLANATPETRLALAWLYGLLFLTGVAVDLLLVRHENRHPSDEKALTAALAARAWSGPEVGIVFGILFALYVLASVVVRFFGNQATDAARMATTALIYALVLVPIGLIHRRHAASQPAVAASPVRPLLLAPLLYLAALPAMMLAAAGWQAILKHGFHYDGGMQDAVRIATGPASPLRILFMLAGVLAAPVYEELLFRGILFPFLLKRAGLPAATATTGALFAAMHFHIPSFAPLFVLSCALSLAYWRTGSLRVCMGMHAIFNAVSFLALSAVSAGGLD